MAPTKTSWDDEEESSSAESSSPVIAPAVRRGKFEDEEDEDVLESWDAAEDSEEERAKAKKAAEAKAKAEAAAKANHKSKSQKLEEFREAKLRQLAEAEDEEDSDEEDEAERRARTRASEQASDLQHALDLFGGVGGVPDSRGAAKVVTVQQGDDPVDTIDLSTLKIFNPQTAQQFVKLRDTLVPLLNQNGKKAGYEGFMKEFTKQIVRDLNSEQVKKIASGLTTISNEKMKEEKAADKGGKKTKAAKTKTTLNASRHVARAADTAAYDDGLEEDDFM